MTARSVTPLGPTLARAQQRYQQALVALHAAEDAADAVASRVRQARHAVDLALAELVAETTRQSAPPSSQQQWRTIREACEYTHLAKQTISKLAQQGTIKSQAVGRARRVWWPDVVALLADGRAS